ncbi:unnamed protein product [Acanthoscelides obtectus]|uniref:Immunoglobulin I-set domain-containing protein n=1 Tax=Acanthoscelides obtectus TaxID=200917 RepID=A0A9P0MBT2_ACAOB|nr:unnamed protein product [Acanthoscelides obtectus]CAK1673029.1 hypothetical protein AOBTE_LOCUS29210 [Acanthoscelides obtectus]
MIRRGEMVISSSKYDVQTTSKSVFHVRMTVIVRQLQREDVGSYRCIAKNSLGEVESNIRLYEIPGPTKPYGPSIDEEDYNEQFGSAEREEDVQLSNLDNASYQESTTEAPPRVNYMNNKVIGDEDMVLMTEDDAEKDEISDSRRTQANARLLYLVLLGMKYFV